MTCWKPLATDLSAVSQAMRVSVPSLCRRIGCRSRPSSESVSPSADPLEHSRPRFAGWFGSPAITAPPRPSGLANTPQPTPQYGQVVRIAGGGWAGAFMAASRRPALGQRAPECEAVANGLDRSAGADEVEVPQPIRGIAVEHGADEAIAGEHQLLVDAEPRISEHDFVGTGAAEKIARREHVHARDLEIGGEQAARIFRRSLPGEAARQHLRLLVGGLDQAVARAAMLGALADRVDAGATRLQAVVDLDAAIDVEAGARREIGVGADTDRHDHEVGGKHGSVREFHR